MGCTMNRDPDATTSRQQRSHQRSWRALLSSTPTIAYKLLVLRAAPLPGIPRNLPLLPRRRSAGGTVA
jgi:hypothetical protein